MVKELVIKVNNQGVYLSPKLLVPVHQTNIPAEHLKFRTYEDIFWKVKLIDYNHNTKCWKVEVTNYFTNEIQNFDKQRSTKEVERISFEKFDWFKLEQHLSSYQKSKLLVVLKNHDADKFFRADSKLKAPPAFSDAKFPMLKPETKLAQTSEPIIPSVPIERKPISYTFRVEFPVKFTNAKFMLGYVLITKYIKELDSNVDFKIKNEYILAEFNNIKSWFAKKLKTKKFNVTATITTIDRGITGVIANSLHIAMIDAELIESVKYERTISLTKSPTSANPDKSLFTAEDIFVEMNTDDKESNIFKQSEMDILNFLIDKQSTRNKRHLQYLSGSKQSEQYKIRFTLHPLFGFLFLIEGQENNHFVWELLNSHATYLWSISRSDSEIRIQYKRIEDLINTIRSSGRENYKRSYRQTHHDSDLVFSVIDHDKITSNFVDGFVKWKHKLNERLT